MKKKSKKMIKMLFVFFSVLKLLGYSNCHAQSNKVSSCTLLKNVYTHFDQIVSNNLTNVLNNSSDKCNLSLVDSIIGKFIYNADYKSYQMLQNLAKCSDGYLSDYLVEKVGKIYTHRFFDLFNYLYEDHAKGINNKIEYYLIESWSSIASLSNNPDLEVIKIKIKTTKIVSTSKKDEKDKIEYLKSLVKKINSKYLDL